MAQRRPCGPGGGSRRDHGQRHPLLSDRYEGEERNLAIGAWGSFATAAGLLAPTLGGVLAETFGWRAVFAVNLPLGVAAWVLAVRVLPRSPRASGGGRTDWLGSLLLMLGLGAATLLMLRSGDTPWSGRETAVLLTACAALTAFLAVQLKAPAPTLELRMFGSPAFSGAMLAVLLSRVLAIGGSVYLVLYFSDGLGLSPTGAGLLMTPIFLAQIVMGMVGSKLIGDRPPGLVIGSGYALKGVGLAALALVITPDTPWWALVAPLLAWGAGGGIAGAPVTAVAVRVTAPERVGMVAGTVSTLASPRSAPVSAPRRSAPSSPSPEGTAPRRSPTAPGPCWACPRCSRSSPCSPPSRSSGRAAFRPADRPPPPPRRRRAASPPPPTGENHGAPLYPASCRRTISAIQSGAYGDVQPGEVGWSLSTSSRSPMPTARARRPGWSIPIRARQWFIAH